MRPITHPDGCAVFITGEMIGSVLKNINACKIPANDLTIAAFIFIRCGLFTFFQHMASQQNIKK